MMESEQTAELAAALAKAQAVMAPAAFDRVNPHFKSRYATLAAVFNALKPIHENGLSVTQSTQFRDGAFLLRTTLRHTSGQWIASDYPLPLNAKPQEIGSALTYARRYSLSALTGIVADEDDGGEAIRRANGNGQHIETGEVISDEQAETIRALLTATKSDVKKFLNYAGAESVSDIHASKYLDAVKLLETKKQQATKQ